MDGGQELIIDYLITDMIFEQVKEMDFDFDGMMRTKPVKILMEIYKEMERNIPDKCKIQHIFAIFEKYGILVGMSPFPEENDKSEA